MVTSIIAITLYNNRTILKCIFYFLHLVSLKNKIHIPKLASFHLHLTAIKKKILSLENMLNCVDHTKFAMNHLKDFDYVGKHHLQSVGSIF